MKIIRSRKGRTLVCVIALVLGLTILAPAVLKYSLDKRYWCKTVAWTTAIHAHAGVGANWTDKGLKDWDVGHTIRGRAETEAYVANPYSRNTTDYDTGFFTIEIKRNWRKNKVGKFGGRRAFKWGRPNQQKMARSRGHCGTARPSPDFDSYGYSSGGGNSNSNDPQDQ